MSETTRRLLGCFTPRGHEIIDCSKSFWRLTQIQSKRVSDSEQYCARAAKPPRTLLAASPLTRGSCSATFSPRIFEQKRDCSQSRQLLNNHIHKLSRIFHTNLGIQVLLILKGLLSFYFAEVLLEVKLRRSELFHSHLEGLAYLNQNEFSKQVCEAKLISTCARNILYLILRWKHRRKHKRVA